ncbi:MarR family transcriptional regulator [Alsobacter sp. SYSU M60028]|uniref:MarR family transcriptional regulator n=1 Tax=Alsobacter ponti TaxID=2962936 RepID=A0ABT1L844_9HYPH|nr:MarR family transcriptional regulator [Alsobacter ponti]MCP8937554.1 MarR family transcriptional regulator [Alsobacter ponti]
MDESPDLTQARGKLAHRELAFLIADVARLMRTATDQQAGAAGTSRARWAVLVRIEKHPGLSQNELAHLLDIQPITLGRLVDRLCEEGLVERRPDASDRRVKRLHLLEKAYPVLDQLSVIGRSLMGRAFHGLDGGAVARLIDDLSTVKHNLRRELNCAPLDRTAS